MSQTLISWMQRVKKGLQFRETFENPNYIEASGWDVTQGQPFQSNLQAKNGFFSCPMAGTQDINGDPLVITNDVSALGVKVVSGWFYDDASVVDVVNEQTVTPQQPPTGGAVTLGWNSFNIGPINWNDSNATIQAAFDTAIGSGNSVVTGDFSTFLDVQFTGIYAGMSVPLITTVTSSLVYPLNEIQTITFSSVAGRATAGSFDLNWNGNFANILYNDPNTTIQPTIQTKILNLIQAFSGAGAGVTTDGTVQTETIRVEFTGTLAGASQPLFTITSNTLMAFTHPVTVTVTEVQAGGSSTPDPLSVAVIKTYRPGPFLKVVDSAGKFIQMGVRNQISTTLYCAGSGTEDAFVTLAATRTTGWHSFTFIKSGSNSVQIVLDGVGFINVTGVTFPLNKIYVQAASVADGAVDSFGFFDEIHAFTDSVITFSGVSGRRVVLKSSTESVLGNHDQNLSTDTLQSNEIPDSPEPPQISVEVSQKIISNSVGANYAKFCVRRQKNVMTMGDVWVLKSLEFGRKITVIQNMPMGDAISGISINRTSQTLQTALANQVPVQFNAFDDSFRNKLEEFFQFARTGDTFSLVVDTDRIGFATVISSNLVAGSISAFAVQATLLTTAGNLVKGDVKIQNTQQSQRQLSTITNISGANITLSSYLDSNGIGDNYVCDTYLFPYLFLEPGKNSLGITLAEQGYLSQGYRWAETFREFVQGDAV